MQLECIRNFCVFAHIDNGKSTLADRLLQITSTISVHEMTDQISKFIVHRIDASAKGQSLVTKGERIIPRQLYRLPIQAAAVERVISRANVKALRKVVLAKCYGGDVAQKKKLLEKQIKVNKRMKMVGHIEIPQGATLDRIRLGDV